MGEGNGTRGSSGYWCAREKGNRASSLSGPRWRRCGGRRSFGGARGRAGEDTARGVEGGGELKRDAWVPAQAGGGPGGGPERRAALPSSGDKRSREAGWRKEKRDLNAISKSPGTQL